MASASSHVDRRYRYLRGLWPRATSSMVAAYKEKEFQHLCKALARISTAADPLPNRHAVRLGGHILSRDLWAVP